MPSSRQLPAEFYARPTLIVARELLGKRLIVQRDGAPAVGGTIVETEAYGGVDLASHSARGLTRRCAAMFGPPAKTYVYLCYGFYQMLNLVTEPQGQAGAVLIRAIEPTVGRQTMLSRVPTPRRAVDLTNGPGKVCRACGITAQDHGASLQGPIFRVEEAPVPELISVSPRVGISKAIDEPWRYFITGHPYVSRAPQNALAQRWIPE